MDIIALIAEDKIKRAMENGEFDNLPGKGKPLNLKDDLPGMPQDIKMAYRLLKNAGYVTDEIELKKQITSLEDLLAVCVDEKEKAGLYRKLSEKRIRFEQMLEKKHGNPKVNFGQYHEKIVQKLD